MAPPRSRGNIRVRVERELKKLSKAREKREARELRGRTPQSLADYILGMK